MTSVDRGHVDRDLAAWLDVTSGPLHDQLTRSHTSDTARLKAADTTARGDVTETYLQSLQRQIERLQRQLEREARARQEESQRGESTGE